MPLGDVPEASTESSYLEFKARGQADSTSDPAADAVNLKVNLRKFPKAQMAGSQGGQS